MWSVVTLSPSKAKTRAPRTSVCGTSATSSALGQTSRRYTGPAVPEPERIGGEIGFGGAGDREGDDEWRRGPVVEADLWVDPTFEVAVARQHGANGQVGTSDGHRHLGRERA